MISLNLADFFPLLLLESNKRMNRETYHLNKYTWICFYTPNLDVFLNIDNGMHRFFFIFVYSIDISIQFIACHSKISYPKAHRHIPHS